jgi:hypothetical protein
MTTYQRAWNKAGWYIAPVALVLSALLAWWLL